MSLVRQGWCCCALMSPEGQTVAVHKTRPDDRVVFHIWGCHYSNVKRRSWSLDSQELKGWDLWELTRWPNSVPLHAVITTVSICVCMHYGNSHSPSALQFASWMNKVHYGFLMSFNMQQQVFFFPQYWNLHCYALAFKIFHHSHCWMLTPSGPCFFNFRCSQK